MKSRTSASIRAPGQRSIPSTFLFRSLPKCSSISKEGSAVPSSRGSGGGRSPLSLSAFLDRKLHSTPVLPTHKFEKEKVSSLLENKHPNGSIAWKNQNTCEGPHEEKRPVIEDSVFKTLSDKQGRRVEMASPEGMTVTELGKLDGNVKKHIKNHVVVLGEEPKPKKRANAEYSSRTKRPRPLYNHYKNGTGWWDSEREGIDEDEVGAKEIWEGVGSATLGGLEWH